MRQFLAILVTALLVESASAQSLWRNFFTTNRDPIVEVVAGSNATVQATTVGSNLRRFTVNSTATGGGLAQTNISYEAVTNAPWQIGSANLTNWSGISTNLAAFLANNQVFTGSNYFTQPLTASLATNTPSAGQVLTATSAGSAKWDTDVKYNTLGGFFSHSFLNATPKYTPPLGSFTESSVEANVQQPFVSGGILTNLFVRTSAIGSGTNFALIVFTNGVASSLLVTYVGNGAIQSASDTATGILIPANTTISMCATGNNASASSARILWTFEKHYTR